VLFFDVVIEAAIIYFAARRAQIEGGTFYMYLGLAVAEVVAGTFSPLMLFPATQMRVGIWAGPALSLLVLLVLMLLLLEGSLGRILYAWFLAGLGILAWKLLSWLLVRAAITRMVSGAVWLLCSHAP